MFSRLPVWQIVQRQAKLAQQQAQLMASQKPERVGETGAGHCPVFRVVSVSDMESAVSKADGCCEWLVQMKERLEAQQQEMDEGWKQQRQLLQAQEQDAAAWKADTQRQLNLQQVCLVISLVVILCSVMALSVACISARKAAFPAAALCPLSLGQECCAKALDVNDSQQGVACLGLRTLSASSI